MKIILSLAYERYKPGDCWSRWSAIPASQSSSDPYTLVTLFFFYSGHTFCDWIQVPPALCRRVGQGDRVSH